MIEKYMKSAEDMAMKIVDGDGFKYQQYDKSNLIVACIMLDVLEEIKTLKDEIGKLKAEEPKKVEDKKPIAPKK